MPLLKVCCYAGCNKAVPVGTKYCTAHAQKGAQYEAQCDTARKRQADKFRGDAAARGYGYRWSKARASFLKHNPLCVHCLTNGITTPATDVDHIIPHKGDKALFWDAENWQALCHSCHSRKTAKEDGAFGKPVIKK